MAVAPHDHTHPRRLEQSAGGDVPARPGQYRVPGGGEARVVGHHPAGHQADGRASWQAECLDHPTAGDDLDGGRGGRQRVDAGVLVPGGGQYVGAERSRHRAADHEPEEPRTGRRGKSRVRGPGQLLHHRHRIGPRLGQRPVERGQHLLEGRPRPHRPRAQPGEEVLRQPVRSRQHPSRVVHGVTIARTGADMVGRDRHPLTIRPVRRRRRSGTSACSARPVQSSNARPRGRPHLPRRLLRRPRRDLRRGRVLDRYERLPGDAHRPVVPPPGRRDDGPARRQHRHERRGPGVLEDLGERVRRPRPRPPPLLVAVPAVPRRRAARPGRGRHQRHRHPRADPAPARARRHAGRHLLDRDLVRRPAGARPGLRRDVRRQPLGRGQHERAVRRPGRGGEAGSPSPPSTSASRPTPRG